jgi:Mrp family chromosome partitioning ATPase
LHYVVVCSNITTTPYYITGEIMERKSKVTQSTVNAACEQLQADSKNVTVNAIISITGGSFSTVGDMVKLWREEQAAHSAPLLQMPDSVTNIVYMVLYIYNYIGVQTMTFKLVNIWNPKGGQGKSMIAINLAAVTI